MACRSSLIRFAVCSLNNEVDKNVALLFMQRYSDVQVRQELKITINQLKESKQRIKEALNVVGVNENVI